MSRGMDMKEAAKECWCLSCPTYCDCGELAFCFSKRERSSCIKKENGCICERCPVKEKMCLAHSFYCTRGGESKQTTKTERAHLKK